MKRSPAVNIVALLGAVLFWRLAAEREPEPRQRRAPVTVELRDGTRVAVEVDTPALPAPAAGDPPISGPAPASHRRTGRGRYAEALTMPLLVLVAVVGVAATVFAVTHPFEGIAWAAALGGLALAGGCWYLAGRIGSVDAETAPSSPQGPVPEPPRQLRRVTRA